MLVLLGFSMIAVFMALILTKRLTPAVALILVPVAFGIAAGAGLGVGDAVTDQLKTFAPTAALLFFAIIYFGLMIDVGLFDPMIRFILRVCGNDPVKVVVGTAILAGVVSLDGDGSTTFIITVSAMLPVYLRLGMSPVVLTVVANLANGVLNILPWGGPTVRAATALEVSATDLFNPMVPSMIAGMVAVVVLALMLGVSERRRLARSGRTLDLVAAEVRDGTRVPLVARRGGAAGGPGTPGTAGAVGDLGTTTTASSSAAASAGGSGRSGGVAVAERTATGGAGGDSTGAPTGSGSAGAPVDDPTDMASGLDPHRATLRPKLIWFNLALTVALLVALGLDVLPLSFVFMVAASLALLVNFPHPGDQAARITAHSSSIVSVVAMVFAAAVLTGVLEGTGMVEAMASWLVGVVPPALGPHFALITGLLSMPLTFFMSNDAFYFGVLPVLSEAAAQYGITPVEMARASIIGQPVHMTSPLVPAMLLLISLAKVDLADHHKKVIWRAVVVSLVMLATSAALGVIPIG